jgi:hypothetical protein
MCRGPARMSLWSGILGAHFADRGRAFRAMVGADST